LDGEDEAAEDEEPDYQDALEEGEVLVEHDGVVDKELYW
jgi:hypothetical protein